MIIYGTGFETHNFVAPMEVHGLDGKRAQRGLGRAGRGLPGDHRLRLPEHVRPVRARTPTTARARSRSRSSRQFNYVIDAHPPAARRGLPLDRPAARDPGGVAGGDGASAAPTPSGRPAAAATGT